MLSRKNRFHGHGGVRRVYRQGKPTRTGLMTMHVLKNERTNTTRIAVVVSRKVDKSAVRRNRVRRRIYEIVRAKMPDFKAPAEIVITVYQADPATMSAEQLNSVIDDLIQKAKL